MTGLFIVISAPSGAGKTSICREFLKMFPEVIFSVSHTTRSPRPGEIDGRDYHFVSERVFRELIARDEFLEWEENFGFLYGTSRQAVKDCLASGRDVLLDIDPKGARKVKERLAEGVYVFILPGSRRELENRLRGRGDAPEVVLTRLARAEADMREMTWYDYLVVNENLPVAIDTLVSIYKAAKVRREKMGDIMASFLGPAEKW